MRLLPPSWPSPCKPCTWAVYPCLPRLPARLCLQAQAQAAPRKLHGFELVEEQYVSEYNSQVSPTGQLL